MLCCDGQSGGFPLEATFLIPTSIHIMLSFYAPFTSNTYTIHDESVSYDVE
jgi:hypothetical protein